MLSPSEPSQNPNPRPVSTSRNHKRWLTFDSLKNEHVRRRTFRGWPVSFLSPDELARAGFFYLKKKDYVECAFCRGVVGEWEQGDKPFQEHKKHFRWCPFVNGLPVGNSSSDDEEELGANGEDELELEELGRGYDTCQRYVDEFRPNSRPERANSMYKNVQLKNGVKIDPEALGLITNHRGPKFRQYLSLESRLATFKDWPAEMKQTPNEMAEAGFFYAGLSDHVKCFSCGGGLRNWDKDDDPWREHAYWFFRCPFVQLEKGKEYIKMVRGDDGIPKEVHRPITLDMCMKSAIVRKAREMGFETPQIQRAVEKRLEDKGRMFGSVGSLAELLLDEEEAEERARKSTNTGNRTEISATETRVENGVVENGITETQSTETQNRSPDSGFNSVEEEKAAEIVASVLQSTTLQNGGETVVTVAPTKVVTNGLDVGPELKRNTQVSIKDDDANMCKVCLDELLGVAFMPCGHLCGIKCAPALSSCPICRTPIQANFRIYL